MIVASRVKNFINLKTIFGACLFIPIFRKKIYIKVIKKVTEIL